MRRLILGLGLLSGCYVELSEPESVGFSAGGPVRFADGETGVSRAALQGDVAAVHDLGAVHASAFGDHAFLSLMIDGEAPGGYAMVGVDVAPGDGRLEPGDSFEIGGDDNGDGFPDASGIACSGENSGVWDYDAPIASGQIDIEAGATSTARIVRFRGVLDTGQVVTGQADVELAVTP